MGKAEERAFEAYPDFKVGDSFSSVKLNKQRKLIRHGFIEGYHQAEKDLELTLEDVRTILNIENDILSECNSQKELVIETYPKGEDYYGEILKRFKEHNKL